MNSYDKAFVTRISATVVYMTLAKRFNGLNYLLLPIFFTYLNTIKYDISATDGPYATRSFAYKARDRLADVLSYMLAFTLFPRDIGYMYCVFFRLIGVLLFGMTRDDRWLILFPDVAGEYLTYHFIYKGEMSGFPLLIPVKMIYERWSVVNNQPILTQKNKIFHR